jgi:hypothetical protein
MKLHKRSACHVAASIRSRKPVDQQCVARFSLFADLHAIEILLSRKDFSSAYESPATKAWIVSGEQPSARLFTSTYALFP